MNKPFKVHRIGLTGGVASGKSEVARLLWQHGVPVIDMDVIARDLTNNNPEIKAGLKKIFGGNVLKDGHLDRLQIRELVFTDPGLRKQLEALLHPPILKLFELEAAELAKRGHWIVVAEAALLVESGYYKDFDELTVVIAPIESKKERLIARDRIDEQLANQMIHAQLPDAEKAKLANYVIENNGTLKKLQADVAALVTHWRNQRGDGPVQPI